MGAVCPRHHAGEAAGHNVLTAQEAEANGMGADEHTQEELDATMEEPQRRRQAERLLPRRRI